MEPDPTRRWRLQAARCCAEWRSLTPARTDALITRLEAEDHPIGRVWIDVLRRTHPLAAWLDADDPALPAPFERPSLRQLVTSHPFTDRPPWSSPTRSPASSSTPPG